MTPDIQNIIKLLNNSISENRNIATLAYAKILSNYANNSEITGILLKSLMKSGGSTLVEKYFHEISIDVTSNIYVAEAYFDYLCVQLRFEEAFLHTWNCLNTKHLNGNLSYIENTLHRMDRGEIKQGRTKEFIDAKAALICQLEIPLKDKIILSFSGIKYDIDICKPLNLGSEPRIFFDTTLLLRMIAANRNPTGIQRLLCEMINATYALYPNCYIFFVIPNQSAALTMHASEFLNIINSNKSNCEVEKILFGEKSIIEKRGVKIFNATDADSIIMADAFWQSNILPHIISQIDLMKCKKILLVYDLIPLVLDHEPADREVFESCLLSILGNIDEILTISEFTKSQVEDFLNHKSIIQKCTALPLACQKPTIFPSFSIDGDTFSDFVKVKSLSEESFILNVSSVSRRKRTLELATSFYQLILDHDIDLKLVIVGVDASGSSNIGEKLEEVCARSNGNIIWLKSIGDKTLDELYKSCMFCVYPSSYEGWGLPVGEALAYGKVPIVHAVTSIPEVGQDYAVYCEMNHQSIVSTIVKLFKNRDLLKIYETRISDANLRIWADVARDIIEITL